MKSVLIAFLLFSNVVLAQISGADLTKAQPGTLDSYQFMHCFPVGARDDQKVVHYVIDIRSDLQHQLYVTSDIKTAKLLKLQNLALIDSNVDTTIRADDVDVQWTSAKNGIDLQMVIQTTDGELMEGNLVQKHQTVPFKCLDASYE